MTTSVDVGDLEAKVRQMYRQVAEQPQAIYHFEMGRALAQRLGYRGELLGAVPEEAVESFAGVGYFFDLAGLEPGEKVAAAQGWTP
jgi:arsenite methyltransferase